MDWLLSAVALILLPSVAAAATIFLGSWYTRRALRELRMDLAVQEDRLYREVKRRAAEDRWDKTAPAAGDVETAVKELRALAVGETDGQGFVQGKEGGVYHGPR